MRLPLHAVTGAAALALLGSPALAQHVAPQHAQPYAGLQERPISTLSPQDVEALRAGHGWGLAKPAELNGYPGPAHVLELADKLELTAKQKARVEQIFKRMQMRAKSVGARYIAAEAAIDQVFRTGTAYTGGALQTQLRDAERLRAELRRVHLEAHVETTPILSETQRKKYTELRGYAGGHGGHGQHKH